MLSEWLLFLSPSSFGASLIHSLPAPLTHSTWAHTWTDRQTHGRVCVCVCVLALCSSIGSPLPSLPHSLSSWSVVPWTEYRTINTTLT
ncbi:uncharacterized protein LY79DRAFT_565560 [Colletotrichum navitas]|uniref:Uncharacterized protein n=1 Tax=Colletotrichum navitas TaxID=681940 RepID=A0AAD8PQM2_9PEZI|nr:uncharacterized protein LY79DRAFT_565560 [Colletotrichum navitas]KAK1574585.1 hypothetical protein LY79DRAFT_565560 [Colletotrichum navitas]